MLASFSTSKSSAKWDFMYSKVNAPLFGVSSRSAFAERFNLMHRPMRCAKI